MRGEATHHIVNNTALRDFSWEGIRFLFFEDTRDLRYYPLSYLSFALDIRLFGLDPFWMHFENWALHAANTLLVAGLVRAVTKDDVAALVTGLLFSVHPLQVESVAWVFSRRNVLFLFFFLLSARTYVAFARAPDRREARAVAALVGSVVLYVLACLSKSAAITLPAVLVLLDYAFDPERRPPLGRFLARSLPSKLWYVPALVLFFAIAQRTGPNPFLRDYGFSSFEWGEIIGHNFFFYLAKTLAPIHLGFFYPLPSAGEVPGYFLLFAGLGLAAAAATLWCGWRGAKFVFVGLAWYWVTILPLAIVLFFFSDLPLLAADRYYYQSGVGVFWAAGVGASFAWSRLPRWRGPLLGGALALLCVLVVVSSQHRSTFRNTIAFYEQLLRHHPSDEFFYRLALEYSAAGRSEDASEALDAAENARHKIFFVDFLYYRLRLADLYVRKGDFAGAADQLEAGLAALPNAYEAGGAPDPLAYRVLSELRERAGDPAAAGEALAKAGTTPPDPGHYCARLWIGFSPEESGAFLQRRVASHPEDGRAWAHLALHAQATGDANAARAYSERAAELGQPTGGFLDAAPHEGASH